MSADPDSRLQRAAELYERAVFADDDQAVAVGEVLLDGVEADLALARGRLLHARYLRERVEDPRELELFEHAAERFRELGDERGEAEALFWIGAVYQVIRENNTAALVPLKRAYDLAVRTGDRVTQSYAVRHLGFVDAVEGRPAEARSKLKESLALRRDIGFSPGVAAGILALAELAADQGNHAEASTLLEEAERVARECGADGVLEWIAAARD